MRCQSTDSLHNVVAKSVVKGWNLHFLLIFNCSFQMRVFFLFFFKYILIWGWAWGNDWPTQKQFSPPPQHQTTWSLTGEPTSLAADVILQGLQSDCCTASHSYLYPVSTSWGIWEWRFQLIHLVKQLYSLVMNLILNLLVIATLLHCVLYLQT